MNPLIALAGSALAVLFVNNRLAARAAKPTAGSPPAAKEEDHATAEKPVGDKRFDNVRRAARRQARLIPANDLRVEAKPAEGPALPQSGGAGKSKRDAAGKFIAIKPAPSPAVAATGM